MQQCHSQSQVDDPPKIQARPFEIPRPYSSRKRPGWYQNSPSFLPMAQSVPLPLRHQGRSHIHGPKWTPLIRRQASGRKLTNHSLQPHSHHLGKTHLTLPRNPLGLPKKVIGNLYLGFYHDGNLPAYVCLSNAIQKKISPTCCARKGVCPTHSHIKKVSALPKRHSRTE